MATVAFNAPHAVASKPERWDGPAPNDYSARSEQTNKAYYRSMLEYVDISIGTLLAGIVRDVLERTTIIFMRDNGTPSSNQRSL